MKVSFYELLGMVKEGKAPKKIKEKFSDGFQEQYFLDEEGWYTTLDGTSKMNIFKVDRLNDEVEIIEEDKNIDYVNTYVLCDSDFKEKGNFSFKSTEIIDKAFEEYSVAINKIIDKLNERDEDV